MKLVNLTIELSCRDDVPQDVVEWMANNLAAYADRKFYRDYYGRPWEIFESEGCVGRIYEFDYTERPLVEDVTIRIDGTELPAAPGYRRSVP